MKYTDIKTVEDACKLTGETLNIPEGLPKDVENYMKLRVVNKALNMENGEPWQPNWADWNEIKYYPWFDMWKAGGVGFSFRGYGYGSTHSGSCVGSRLCFRSRELAEYAAKQFEAEYKAFFQ